MIFFFPIAFMSGDFLRSRGRQRRPFADRLAEIGALQKRPEKKNRQTFGKKLEVGMLISGPSFFIDLIK